MLFYTKNIVVTSSYCARRPGIDDGRRLIGCHWSSCACCMLLLMLLVMVMMSR